MINENDTPGPNNRKFLNVSELEKSLAAVKDKEIRVTAQVRFNDGTMKEVDVRHIGIYQGLDLPFKRIILLLQPINNKET